MLTGNLFPKNRSIIKIAFQEKTEQILYIGKLILSSTNAVVFNQGSVEHQVTASTVEGFRQNVYRYNDRQKSSNSLVKTLLGPE